MTQPTLILIMGVAGSGKSTLAKATANNLDYEYIDADDFHSEEAINMMSSGIPLNDEQRLPWIEAIISYLNNKVKKEVNCVLAFSGLKKSYRKKFNVLNFQTASFLLQGDFELLSSRLKKRQNHFMTAAMLHSQFDTLELPKKDEKLTLLNCSDNIETLCSAIISQLKN